MDLHMRDGPMLRACIEGVGEGDTRGLHVLGHALAANTPKDFSRSTRTTLAKKTDAIIDAMLKNYRKPDRYVQDYLADLERLEGCDPAQNKIIVKFNELLDRSGAEIEALKKDLGSWTLMHIERKQALLGTGTR